jgi:hypothetical protein
MEGMAEYIVSYYHFLNSGIVYDKAPQTAA